LQDRLRREHDREMNTSARPTISGRRGCCLGLTGQKQSLE